MCIRDRCCLQPPDCPPQAVDTSVASGAVIRTDPAAGSQVAAGSTVVMYISRPQVATTTKVPSLTGMSTACLLYTSICV